jgi:hypothetical protein
MENKNKKINRIITFGKRWFSFIVSYLLSLKYFYLLLIKLFLLVVFPSLSVTLLKERENTSLI